MKKQLSFISLSLAMTVLTYLVSGLDKAYAGRDLPPGIPIDAGGNINVPSPENPPIVPAPGTNVQVEIVAPPVGGTPTVVLSVPPTVQTNLNNVVTTAINQLGSTTSPVIASVLQGNVAASTALASSLVNSGLSPETVTPLVIALSGLQTGGTVNINNVNAAITALNQLVRGSSPQALQALANNPNIRAAVNLLRQLRVAVSQN